MNKDAQESLEAIKCLQEKLKTDPDAVTKILISAGIIDENGNLTKHYSGEKFDK
jgi:hypothetical protein